MPMSIRSFQQVASNPETVLITGACSGIGLELARCFAQDGSRLIIVARNSERLQKTVDGLKESYRVDVEGILADLREQDAAEQIHGCLGSKDTRVDVLVNNAGIGGYGRFKDLSFKRQLEIMQVNVLAGIGLMRFLLPGMVERRCGGILNVVSTAAFQAGPEMAVYAAGKACFLSLTEAVAEEIRGYGVRITAFCPGPTRTDFARNSDVEFSAMFTRYAMSSSRAALIGYRAFRKGRPLVIAGWGNRLAVFGVRFLPRAWVCRTAGYLNSLSYTKTCC